MGAKTIFEKYRAILICVLLAATTLAVYWPLHNYEFVGYDDNDYVYENPHVRSGLNRETVKWAFTTGKASNWHPVTWLSHILDAEFFALNAGAHHLVNLFLHAVNSLLLFFLLKRATTALYPAAFVAALFALHPLHVESVAWVSERKDVLSTFFALLTMLAWIRYIKCRHVLWYIGAVLLFAIGLMAKPMLVTLPFILLLLDYWPLERLKFSSRNAAIDKRKEEFRKLISEKIPFFVLSALSSFVTFFVQQGGGALLMPGVVGAKIRILNAAISYVGYIEKMFWPAGLAVLYPHPAGDISALKAFICILLLLALTVLFLYLGTRRKYLAVGWLWYLGTLVPVIGLVQVGVQAMADRYTYLPLIGPFIMLAWGIPEIVTRCKRGKTFIGFAAGAAIAVFAVLSRIQLSYWQNSITLFSRALKVTKNNFVIHNNLGNIYIGLGRYQEAIDSCRQAISINPDYANPYYNLGIIYDILGRHETSIECLKQAVKIRPDYAGAHFYLGFAHLKTAQFDNAIESFKHAIEIKPDYAEAYNNLGNAFLRLGRLQEALDAFNEAIRIEPDYAHAYANLGMAFNILGNYDKAIESCELAVKIDPNYAPAYYNLGNASLAMGRYSEAAESYKHVVKLNPDDTDAHYNLGVVYTITGNKDFALAEYETLKTLDAARADKLFGLINAGK